MKTVNGDVEQTDIDEQAKVVGKDRYKKEFSKITHSSLPFPLYGSF